MQITASSPMVNDGTIDGSEGNVPTIRPKCSRSTAADPNPDLCRHPLDREVGRLEQALRAADARAGDPARRRRADLLAKPPAQRPGAHGGVPCDHGQRQILAEILLEPREERTDRRVVNGRRLVDDELRLAAGALERHHRGARHCRRRLGAEVAPHQVEAQIEACRGARGRQHLAVVDVQHVGVDVDRRVAARQLCARARQCVVARRPSSAPVAARTNAPVQIDATRAPRSTARRIARRTPSGIARSRSSTPGTITVSARFNDDKRHGTFKRHVLRLHLRRDAADPDLDTTARPSAAADPSEHLAWRRQVAEHHAVECHDGDQVPPRTRRALVGANPANIVF